MSPTKVYRPIDVLDLQVSLVKWWRTNPLAPLEAENFQRTLESFGLAVAHPGPDEDPRTAPRVAAEEHPLQRYYADRLNAAECIYVRANVVELLWDFAENWTTQDRETLGRDDPPMDNAFVYLEKPLRLHDVNGYRYPLNALLWTSEHDGLMVSSMYEPQDDDPDPRSRQRREAGAPLGVTHQRMWPYGQQIRNLAADKFAMPERLRERPDGRELHEAMAAQENRVNNFLVALWEFMGEQMPVTQAPDRAMGRRLARAHSPLSEVSVIQLRSYPNERGRSEDPQVVWWTHRWRVREHKRRWVDKHGNQRETTVHAYVKGPEHLPLYEKDRVFNVRR